MGSTKLCSTSVFRLFVCMSILWKPLINMGPTKLCSSSVIRSVNPQSGYVCRHSVCVYVYIVETPDKHGTLKVVIQKCS